MSPRTLNRLFTFGYIAKGTVYILVGGLTLATVLGFARGGPEGPRGIIAWLSEQDFGRVLVGLLGLGLLAYATWRLYRAIVDPHNLGHDKKSALKRTGYAVSGLANGTLGVLALRAALQGSDASGGTSQQGMIATLMQASYGPWLVGLLGLVLIGTGIYQAYKGLSGKFMTGTTYRHLSRQTVERLGRYGHLARGLIFGIIGGFVLVAALRGDASSFRGTEGALEWIRTHSYGVWLLGLTSLGLLFYGAFSVIKGYYGSIARA